MSTTAPADVELSRHDGGEAAALAEELADLYRAVYSRQEPQASDPFYSRERFLDRFAGYSSAPGFELIVARQDGRMVGFLYGYQLPPTSRWWEAVRTEAGEPLPPEFRAESGQRTFAVNDMVVLPELRRHGLARAMHTEVVKGHPGSRFTLTVRPDNDAAQAAYRNWGYRAVGKQQPFPDSPVYNTLVFEPGSGSVTGTGSTDAAARSRTAGTARAARGTR